MTRRNIILVLEDTFSRVSWLKGIIPASFEVEHHLRVSDFLKAAWGFRDRIALVVYDHDLGCAHPDSEHPHSFESPGLARFDYDADGKSGLDAAKEIVAINAPALVWSHNPDGRKAIAHTLNQESKATRIYVGGYESSKKYAEVILGILNDAS